MKSLLTILLFGLLLFVSSATVQAQQTEEKTPEITDQKITLNIEGMVCSMCEEQMKGSLEKIDGVKKVEKVDAKEGAASLWVSSDKTITDDQFKKAVEDAGFKLKKINRDSEDHTGHSH